MPILRMPQLYWARFLQPQPVDVAVNDMDGTGGVRDDDYGVSNEDDIGAGPTSGLLDYTQAYVTNVVLGDGSTIQLILIAIQLQNGDVFLTEFGNNGFLDNRTIQSLELVSVAKDTYIGPVPVESLYPGPLVLRALETWALAELMERFPGLVGGMTCLDAVETAYGYMTRNILKRRYIQTLI